VRIAWKHFPLDMHKDAPLAHLAAAAAGEQGKFWEYHDKLFSNPGKLKLENLQQYARELGLDMKKFDESVQTKREQPMIDADLAEGRTLGVTGTPAFFINGRFLSGAKPFEEFQKLIDASLAGPPAVPR
jgi:protein-disulfide isomerase